MLGSIFSFSSQSSLNVVNSEQTLTITLVPKSHIAQILTQIFPLFHDTILPMFYSHLFGLVSSLWARLQELCLSDPPWAWERHIRILPSQICQVQTLHQRLWVQPCRGLCWSSRHCIAPRVEGEIHWYSCQYVCLLQSWQASNMMSHCLRCCCSFSPPLHPFLSLKMCIQTTRTPGPCSFHLWFTQTWDSRKERRV